MMNLLENPRACLKCGFCCTRGVCGFGRWLPEEGRCDHLVSEGPRKVCGIYDRIVSLPRDRWLMNPAFGAGCSSPLFNVERNRILRIISIKKSANQLHAD